MSDRSDKSEYYQNIACETGKKYLREVSKLSRIISQLRKTEEILQKYRILVESSSDPIFMLDKERRITSFNNAFLLYFGYGEEEIKEKRLDLITGSAKKYKQLEEFLDSIDHVSDSHTLEWEFAKKDGSRIIMEATISSIEDPSARNEQERITGYVAILHDMSARIRNEEVLKAAEEKYRHIFENATEGLFQKDAQGTYLNVNPSFIKIFGFASMHELLAAINQNKKDFIVDSKSFLQLQGLLDEDDVVENFESERYRRNGSKIWTTVNIRVVRDAEGKVSYYEGAVEDITQKKNLESQLRHSQKLEAIGTLAGGIAHDFNNILTAVIGYGSLLKAKLENGSSQQVYINQILASAEKATSLIQNLLAFGRKQPINLKPNNINEMVSDMQKLLERLLTEDIELRMMLAENDMIIISDRTQIEQILMNLVTNARDAMGDRRILTIETKPVEIGTHFIKAHGFGKPGSFALLSVSDTGCGMDEATREHIFEPFFTTKEVGKGTGLGLSTVYGIVKQHQGYITVESVPGEGTTVHVYMPVVRTKLNKIAPVTTKIRGGTETILIAEDDREIRALMKEMLGEQGYDVIEAADGKEAIERFIEHQETIRLAVLDVIMPRKNGKEVHTEIRTMKPSVKTLFFSGYPRDVILDQGADGESFEFLSKPMVPAIFLDKIRAILDR
jgi:PAS domain S-box-containing protein